jgi:4,5-DOPA dioxygenase extradiol
MLPALFLSHGAPTLPLTDAPAKSFLESIASRLPERPRAVLVVSAHWETTQPRVNAVAVNETIHDFFGFPRALHEMTYPAPGSPELGARVSGLLTAAGLPCGIDRARGLDHGAWVPLKLIYPQADIPVVQVSVQTRLGPQHHLAVGRALAPLRDEGVLIVGSGSLTHDLSAFGAYRDRISAPEPEWVTAFADWFNSALSRNATEDLLAYRRLAPFATKNHPSEEHLLPLFVALGAGGDDPRPEHWHASTTHGVLRMDVYASGSGR